MPTSHCLPMSAASSSMLPIIALRADRVVIRQYGQRQHRSANGTIFQWHRFEPRGTVCKLVLHSAVSAVAVINMDGLINLISANFSSIDFGTVTIVSSGGQTNESSLRADISLTNLGSKWRKF
jgi:hypothetical protein